MIGEMSAAVLLKSGWNRQRACRSVTAARHFLERAGAARRGDF